MPVTPHTHDPFLRMDARGVKRPPTEVCKYPISPFYIQSLIMRTSTSISQNGYSFD